MKLQLTKKLMLFAFIIAVSFNSCKERDTSIPEKVAPPEKDAPLKQVAPPKEAISYKKAKVLEREFIATRGKIINKYMDFEEGQEDTREFWFDLETLKQYIKYVEYESNRLGYDNLGIRIYKGAYPKNSDYEDAGFSTVILVPTGNKSVSKGSFLPLNMNTILMNNNLHELQSLNYAHGGKPPKAL